jgi:O-acetyl-ADP-ribose deacetylase (regulator of RNase III)
VITWKEGDLFASGLPAIAHGVNCRGVMGAGIAGYQVKDIGLPMIGCGIGGLRENDLAAALAPYENAPVNLTIFKLPGGTR